MSNPFETHYQPTPVEEWAKTAPATSIPALFRRTITEKKRSEHNFLGAKINGVYRFETYAQIQAKIHQFACALIDLGMQPTDRVAQLSTNRPEWVITDLGSMHAACIHAPLYPTLATEAIEYILQDCSARVCIAMTPAHLKSILEVEGNLPSLEHVITHFDHGNPQSIKKLWTWSQFLEHGQSRLEQLGPEMEKRIAAIQPTDVCSLVYTSGTTGEPKGAMLMHGNFCSNALASVQSLGYQESDLELSFLPLSHVFERVAYYASTAAGASIAYAESIDTIRDNMLEVRPTVMPSVPRLFEKIYAGATEKAAAGGAVKKKLFDAAIRTGKAYFAARQKGKVSGWLKLKYDMAYTVVLKTLHERTGGRIRLFCSGGAPLRKDVGEFFLGAGFTLVEGYGLTETSPVLTVNPPDRPKMGTVGKPVVHTDIKIADDGEIICRGPQVMLGYFNKPQATKDAIDENGYFHTGDIGNFDEEGYLRITDRKKDLLVMSNGKNVAPQPIEQLIQSSPLIEQCVVLGDNQKFVAALIYPTYANLSGWLKENGLSDSPEQLADNPKLNEYMMKEVGRLCADLSGYERVKKIAILPKELTLETGELTPTLKVKRKVVNTKYSDRIKAVYEGGGGD